MKLLIIPHDDKRKKGSLPLFLKFQFLWAVLRAKYQIMLGQLRRSVCSFYTNKGTVYQINTIWVNVTPKLL